MAAMRLRNDERGYGAVAKLLHWSTVSAFAAQFLVGYTMATEAELPDLDCDPPGEDVSGGDLSDAEKAELDREEEQCEAAQDLREDEADDLVGTAWDGLLTGDLGDAGLSLPEAHVLLGVVIIGLGVLRLLWRRAALLPPWAPQLTAWDKRAVHWTETAMLTLQFLVPATGILLVAGDDDLVGAHIAAHVAFVIALAAHLTLVLGRRLLPRMLPGTG
jgi:cytochrome b561